MHPEVTTSDVMSLVTSSLRCFAFYTSVQRKTKNGVFVRSVRAIFRQLFWLLSSIFRKGCS